MYEIDARDHEDEPLDSKTATAPEKRLDGLGRRGARLFGLGAFLLLALGLAFGASRSYSKQREVTATAEQIRNFVPSVRVATVQASDATVLVTLPATTSAFSVANMFARASGYIDKRYVDIGDRVKEGQLLAEIVAPELDHQIAQAEATLGQLRAAVEQAQANKNLAQVTWDRDKGLVEKGWVTPQQGDIDRFTLNAREAALSVAQANVAAQQAQLKVLYQQQGLPARRRPVRRRRHPAQCRRGRPGARRYDNRHVHVHDHAEQRDPRPGLRAAGSGIRIEPGGRCRGARS